MHKYIVDANCLLSFLTDRSLQQYKQIEPYFIQASVFKCTVSIDPITVSEVVYVLGTLYGRQDKEIAAMLSALFTTPGFDVHEKTDISALLHLWPGSVGDFGDAAIASGALSNRYTVLTFDRSFGKELQKLHVPHIVL